VAAAAWGTAGVFARGRTAGGGVATAGKGTGGVSTRGLCPGAGAAGATVAAGKDPVDFPMASLDSLVAV